MKLKLQEALYAVLDAADDDALPGEEWVDVMETAVENFNKRHGTNFDPYKRIRAWQNSQEN